MAATAPKQNPDLYARHVLDGARCEKKQFLEMHAPDLAEPMDEASTMLAKEGVEVEKLARILFPGGVEVLGRDHADGTVGRTGLLRRRKHVPPAIFRGAFRYQGTTVRPKIMVNAGGKTWDVIEVASSTKPKGEDLQRLALVVDTMRRAKVNVRHAYLMHPNAEYELPWHRELDPAAYFQMEDVTDLLQSTYLPEIPSLRKQAKEIHALKHAPHVEMGSHCNSPNPCPFASSCKRLLTPLPIEQLNDLRAPLKTALKERHIRSIRDIPASWATLGGIPEEPKLLEETLAAAQAQNASPEEIAEALKGFKIAGKLSRPKQNQITAAHTGEIVVHEQEMREFLESLPAEKCYMDFEAYSSAIPKEPGHRPYMVIPFQYSIHKEMENGRIYPNSFLHAEGGDPRTRFTEQLTRTLPDRGAYLVWSPYERSRMKDLAKHFLRSAQDLNRLLELGERTAAGISAWARGTPGLDQALVANIVRLHGILLVREQALTKGADRMDEILDQLDHDLAETVRSNGDELMDLVQEEETDKVLGAWDPVLGTEHLFQDLRDGMTNDQAFMTTLSHWHAEFLQFVHKLQLAGGRMLDEEEWPSSLIALREVVGGVLHPRRYPEAYQRLLGETDGAFRTQGTWSRSIEQYGEMGRLVDMLPIQRNLVYHPDQEGSHSIKTIVKTQIKGFSYDDLDIRDGATAQMWFMRIVNGDMTEEELPRICMALIRYCERDTESEIHILSHWKRLVMETPVQRVKRRPIRVRGAAMR